jgi:FMN phosphatase YigB (HAD superfamily)
LSLTLLLDLDNTLLANSMDSFLPSYLQALSRHLSAYAEPSQIVNALMAGTRKMVENLQPDCSLTEVFESAFYPLLGLHEPDLRPAIDDFYARVFPGLRQLTHPTPGGVALVEAAFERGYNVAIATNPLFPLTAIHQRLEWAGLPVEKYPFKLIASHESFHFSKPNPAFLAEMLARMGWPEGPVLMVGDDYKNDIQPARSLGLPTYWLAENAEIPGGAGPLWGSGPLADLMTWLDSHEPQDLEPDFSSPSAMLSVLRATPAALNSLCDELPGPAWTKRPHSGEWSPTEILCHLRDVETEVNLPRLRKVMAESNPFVPGMDTDRWADERQYIHQDGQRALHRFSVSRQQALHLLENLSLSGWDLPARHAIFGPTRLKEMVAISAGHDRLHLRQFCQAL